MVSCINRNLRREDNKQLWLHLIIYFMRKAQEFKIVV